MLGHSKKTSHTPHTEDAENILSSFPDILQRNKFLVRLHDEYNILV